MNRVMVKIRIASANEAANPVSKTQAGTGRIIMTMTAIRATARAIVGLKSVFTVNFVMSVANARTDQQVAARPC